MAFNRKKLDINKAILKELEALSGIGTAKAEAILETRKKLGGFSCLSDLMKANGIGPSLIELNKGQLTCSGKKNGTSRRNRKCERETRSNCRVEHSEKSADQPSTSGHGRRGSRSDSQDVQMPLVRTNSRQSCQAKVALPLSIQAKNNLVNKASREPLTIRTDINDISQISPGADSYSSGSIPLLEPHDEELMNCEVDSNDEDLPENSDETEDESCVDEEDNFKEEDADNDEVTIKEKVPVPMSAVDKLWMKRKSDTGLDSKEQSPGKKPCRSADDPLSANLTFGTIKTQLTSHGTPALRRRIPSKSHPPPELADWLKTFQTWSHPERLLALDELVDLCEPTQVRHVMSVIEPQFQRDFISLLPKELALYVLSFLEPKDLLRAAQTCRYWRILAEDQLLWREKCREENIDEALVFENRLRRRNTPVSPGAPKCQWKKLFMIQHKIEQNWRHGPINTTRPTKVLKGHDDHVITCLEFCGTRIVSGSDDNTLKVWSALTGKCLRTLVGHTGGVWSSQMSGNIIISGSTDRTLKVWNADTGQCTYTLYGHTSTVRCMHLHGNRVVSGSRDATLRVWDITTGQCLHVLMGHVAAVRCVQYDGKKVVSGAYDYMVKVWDAETETCLHTLQGHSNRVYSLQFDGIHIVSGSLDTSIRVWDVESGNCLHTLIGHQSLTSGMELKDNILVSGNADSTVKVWDITTGQCLQTLQGSNKHQSAVTCLQFNKKFVITSSDDGTVKIWDLKTGDFLRNLVALDSGGSGGVVWRVRCSNTKLVCAVGSRNGTEETKLLVLDFDADDS